MIHCVPMRSPTVDGANIHFVVAIHHGDLIAALQLVHRALRNQKSAGLHSAVAVRTLPYWPGRKLFPGFGNSPATRMAPVLTSTWRSAK